MIVYDYKTTGRIFNGNYTSAPMQSGKPLDCPTGKHVAVEVEGKTYVRTIYQRVIWESDIAKRKTIAQFVIVNGVNYEVVEA